MVDEVARARKDACRPTLEDKYTIHGCVGAGTYGVVYKAVCKDDPKRVVAIKKLRLTREGDGLSLTACREVGLLRELSQDSLQHENIVSLRDVLVEPQSKALYLVFDYSEFDLFDMVRLHNKEKSRLPERRVRSLMYQMLSGIYYLHTNWIIHRDLKPSNILVMGDGPDEGVVKVADFGLARIFQDPLQSLSHDGAVVTIWYRAPELLLGAKHYTRAIDMWALGAIFAELLMTRPLFGGVVQEERGKEKEAQMKQLEKIFGTLGSPNANEWKELQYLREWATLPKEMKTMKGELRKELRRYTTDNNAITLLLSMLEYDPTKRVTAKEALEHPYFRDGQIVRNSLIADGPGGKRLQYAQRQIKEEKKMQNKGQAARHGNHGASHAHGAAVVAAAVAAGQGNANNGISRGVPAGATVALRYGQPGAGAAGTGASRKRPAPGGSNASQPSDKAPRNM